MMMVNILPSFCTLQHQKKDHRNVTDMQVPSSLVPVENERKNGWIVANTQVPLTLLVLKGLILIFSTVGRCKLCIYVHVRERRPQRF